MPSPWPATSVPPSLRDKRAISGSVRLSQRAQAIADERETDLPRSPNSSSDEILVNTLKLISEHGISGVTLDMVADISRVSKATIYRRWPSREKLILSAMSYLEVPTEVPDTGDIIQDLRV